MRFPLGGGACAKRVWSISSVAALMLVFAPSAYARSGGIVVDSCHGCHGDGSAPPELTLSAEPQTFEPGDTVTFTLTVQDPSMSVAGTFITTLGVGSFEALAGEGLSMSAQGLTHSRPKAALDGAVTFRFAWQAPGTPGGVDFRVLALAANGNNSVTGDSPGVGAFQWAFGCPARSIYVDLDRDGYGAAHLGVRLGCEGDPVPEGYALMDGDCDENRETVHPGATEVCNGVDDDCDGEVDENAPPVNLWPDGDGDGFYASATGTPRVGCADVEGYAAVGGDCNDNDPTIHPGATEICNGKDDNCDGEVDDHVRPQCGLGWCRRYSTTCDPADCEPGPPAAETCNAFDDDCDGENDNDACPADMICWDSECVAMTVAGAPTGAGGGASGSGGRSDLPDLLVDAGAISSSGGASLVETPVPGSSFAAGGSSFDEPGPAVAIEPSGGTDSTVNPPVTDTASTPPAGAKQEPSSEAGCAVSSFATSQPGRTRESAPGLLLLTWLVFSCRRRRVRPRAGFSGFQKQNRVHYASVVIHRITTKRNRVSRFKRRAKDGVSCALIRWGAGNFFHELRNRDTRSTVCDEH